MTGSHLSTDKWVKIRLSVRCLSVFMPRIQHGRLPQLTQIADVLGNPQWGSQNAAARPSRPHAVQQPTAGRDYLRAADASSFCTDGDGVTVHVGRCASNGRILLVNPEIRFHCTNESS
jgi:hypothetical protein